MYIILKFEDCMKKLLLNLFKKRSINNMENKLIQFCSRHLDLINHYDTSVSQMTKICSSCCEHFMVLSSFMTYHQVCNQSNTTGSTSGTGTAYNSRVPQFTPGFEQSQCCSIFSFLGGGLQIIVCTFVLFLLAIVLSVLLRFTDSDH